MVLKRNQYCRLCTLHKTCNICVNLYCTGIDPPKSTTPYFCSMIIIYYVNRTHNSKFRTRYKWQDKNTLPRVLGFLQLDAFIKLKKDTLSSPNELDFFSYTGETTWSKIKLIYYKDNGRHGLDFLHWRDDKNKDKTYIL